jgi:hypothetical protein
MKMEILLNDYDGIQSLVLRNSERPDYVLIGTCECEVNIEELKLALKKISLK